MHPILFELGPLQIRYYGLMYAIAILCGLPLIQREIRRKQIPITEDQTMNFVMLCVLGGIVGARLYYVFFNWDAYRNNWWEIVKVWHGGLAIHGGVIGGTLVGWWLVTRHHIPFWRMADVVAPALILGQTFGRFGNFMNGDAHGIPTTMPWGVIFPPESIAGREFPDTPIHPVMLYEMGLNFCIFLLLWSIRKKPYKRDGLIACLYIGLYSIDRFFVSFFRADNLKFEQLSVPHIISILLIVLAGWLIARGRLWEQIPETSEKK